ncbi:MAG: metallophosphoesterase [Xanthobacteraceae bacterium]
MPDTCILRFRDVTSDDTISTHRELISSAGYVWWGWWKKEAEPDRPKELEELSERTKYKPLSVGLFDRSKNVYYSAIVASIVFGNNGTICSPEPIKTPRYYSGDKVPAWFKITSIDQIDYSTFADMYARPPIGEGTFFPVWFNRKEHQCRNATDESQFASSTDEMRLGSEYILHISDVHLGADYGFPSASSPGRVPLIELIGRDLRDTKPGLVVISGDFTTQADANVLQDDGLRFLRELSTELSVPAECFVIVPGNHDIALKRWRPLDTSHETSFHLFTRAFYGRDRSYPHVRSFILPNGRKLQILAINSVRLRHESEKQFGYVQWQLYDDLLSTIPYDPEVWRIAVLHHHLVTAPREEALDPDYPEAGISTTVDAGAVIEGLQRHGFALALHGHQHVPAVTRVSRVLRSSSRKELTVAAAGSAGVCSSRLSDEMRDNSYNVVRITNGGGQIEARRYTPGSPPETFGRAGF